MVCAAGGYLGRIRAAPEDLLAWSAQKTAGVGCGEDKEGFSCGWKSCWVSKGDVLPSVALGSSTAGRLEGRDPCTAGLGA